MGDLLDVLVGKVNELHDQVDVNTAEIAEAIELLKEAQDDPAKIQEAIDKLQDTSDALKASDAALQSALPVEPTPEPEPEPTQG